MHLEVSQLCVHANGQPWKVNEKSKKAATWLMWHSNCLDISTCLALFQLLLTSTYPHIHIVHKVGQILCERSNKQTLLYKLRDKRRWLRSTYILFSFIPRIPQRDYESGHLMRLQFYITPDVWRTPPPSTHQSIQNLNGV